MSTNLTVERAVNRQWQLHPSYRGAAVHDILLSNEFAPTEQTERRVDADLQRMLRHCFTAVPYYREQMKSLGFKSRDLRDRATLCQLPVLEKTTLVSRFTELQADYPLPGQSDGGKTQTAGTTGQPTTVRHSNQSLAMFSWLKQRELRWYRIDPRQTQLSIRPSVDFPKLEDGNYLADGRMFRFQAWPTLGGLFQTGEAFGFNATNPVAEQVLLLNRLRPGFLVMQSSCLENLSLQKLSADAVDRLSGAQAISQTLSAAMRDAIETALEVRVHQNYGLNEIGLVASRCDEGGRYHVHTEHCWVELLREDGSPAMPGEWGRIVVTGLQNSIMPIVRYDTGDLARVVSGQCQCGRLLPGFGEVLGRYRRLAYLPEGSYKRFSDIHMVLYEFAEVRRSVLRKFQVYEYRHGGFEVRIDCEESVFEELAALIRLAFEAAYPANPTPSLNILRTDQFHARGLTKFQIFLSEFFPEPSATRARG